MSAGSALEREETYSVGLDLAVRHGVMVCRGKDGVIRVIPNNFGGGGDLIDLPPDAVREVPTELPPAELELEVERDRPLLEWMAEGR